MPRSSAALRTRRLIGLRCILVVLLLFAAGLLDTAAASAATSGIYGCSTTDLALGKVATASSSASGTQTPAKAVDGKTGNKWLSAASDPQWLQVDLGSSLTLCSVTLDWANYASAFAIQISDDATSWVSVLTSGGSGNNPQTLPVSGTGRYIRMYGTARGNLNNGYGLHEFEVFGPAVPAPPVFTSPNSASFTVGSPGTFTITTSGYPMTTSINESGSLPLGLSYSDHGDGTATIAGVPTGAAGSYPVTLTASNGVPPNTAQRLTINVQSTIHQFTVSSTADVATNFGACGNAAQMVPSGGSLREATCAADNLGATTWTIVVPAGTFHLTNGELQLGKVSGSNITLTGAGAASTIIDAGGLSRVLDLDPAIVGGVSNSISGVTISGGWDSTFGGAGIIAGSALASSGDSLTINNTAVTNNTVSGTTSDKPGGGVQFQGGSLTVINSTISGNTSGSSSGSGLEYTANGIAAGEQLTVSGSTFSGNSANASAASTYVGGALAISSPTAAPINVSNSRFVNNTVLGSGAGNARGGGIFAQAGTVTVTGSTFTGNSVTGGSNPGGGAVASTINGKVVLHYNRITGNVSPGGAGANLVSTGAPQNATDNWWGCNTGPGTAGCDTVSGGPTVSPWLVLTATASPATLVGSNAASTITAALTTDSAGNPVSGANLAGAFDTLPVSFADPPGDATVTAAPGAHTAPLSSGQASIDYHSNTTVGPDGDPVSLDNATVTASIEVDEAPSITSADNSTFTVGTAASFTVTTTAGYPTATVLTESGGLPTGISFTDNGDGTATLAGTPADGTAGNYPITITAGNGVSPSPAQNFTLTIA